jgi:predicted phosphodiesterase
MTTHIATLQIPDDCTQIALCGGPYSNFGAVEAFLEVTDDLDYRICLGDMGGFGPLPDRTLELLRAAEVICLQGNYDYAVGYGEHDCGCGYSDPNDQHFAQVSYDYTYARTSPHHREWMQTLPSQIHLKWRDRTLLLCHGSPHQVNEFVWDSETDDAKIQRYLNEFQVDGICATHTGLPWIRRVKTQSGYSGFWLNVGVLGRPAHEGKLHVYYSLLDFPSALAVPIPRVVPLRYDIDPVIQAMQVEGLPIEFQNALKQGIWTTCAAVLPDAERAIKQRV